MIYYSYLLPYIIFQGEISVAKELDRETKESYKFEIEAEDSGLSPVNERERTRLVNFLPYLRHIHLLNMQIKSFTVIL